MSDDRSRPDPAVLARAVRTRSDRVPGQRDMSSFERVLAGPPADGPRVQWMLAWPDGRVTCVDTEDDALAIARRSGGCRIVRHYVTPCVPRPGLRGRRQAS